MSVSRWIRHLFVATQVTLVALAPALLPTPPAGTPAARPGSPSLKVPKTPLTSPGVPQAQEPEQIFFDDFGGPLTDNWEQVSSSTPERTAPVTKDGRTAVKITPEGNLMSHQPIPYDVGTTYRVTSSLTMPRRRGVHPSFWLRTKDSAKVGEMDVVESWGGRSRCSRVHVGFYWAYYPAPAGTVQCQGANYPDDLYEWHEYSVEFTYMGPGRDPATHHALPTRFFVDGRETWAAPNSPLAAEFLRLQNKRNCPDAEQPSCGVAGDKEGEAPGEGPAMYVDYVKVERIGRAPVSTTPNIYAVRDDGTNPVELHTLDATTGYASFTVQTPLALVTPGRRYTVGDVNGDLVSDLYVVGPAPDNPDIADIQVLDGATGFSTVVAQASLPAGRLLARSTTLAAGDYNNDGQGDLYVLRRTGKRPRVDVLDAASGFTTTLASAVAGTPRLPARYWDLAVGDYDNDGRDDLYAINRQDRGRTAVHVLDAGSGFKEFLNQSYAAIPTLTRGAWAVAVADQNNDGRDDLYAVDRDDRGKASVHVMDASTGFATFLFESPTALSAITDPGWQIP